MASTTASHVALKNTPVRQLNVARAFDALSQQESLYAYHFTRASWLGAQSTLHQVSHESPDIFTLLLKLLGSAEPGNAKASIDKLYAAAREQVTDDEWGAFMAYVASFFGNMGNYLSFGDSKFIPGLPAESLAKIMMSCPADAHTKSSLLHLWNQVLDAMYALEPPQVRELGFPPVGCSSYYSPGLTKQEAEMVTAWLRDQKISTENTRVFKRQHIHTGEEALVTADGADSNANAGSADEVPVYEVRAAAAVSRPDVTHDVNGKFKVVIQYGDYQDAMAGVVEELTHAKEHAANDVQRDMLQAYIDHFKTGDLEAHKQSQRLWVKDKGPVVETNIGFIETYRDPLGARAEFEGLVACVNKDMSAKFAALVAAAPELLKTMPWPHEFEKDTFLKPDFTSLEVIAFAGSGVPAGICIPNYDDIRQNLGFKNVSLGNVITAREGEGETITFIAPKDLQLYKALKVAAFEVQVGAHELLGHGSGKLLQQNDDGTLNFDPATTVNPLTKQPVSTYYKPGQTWDSVFGQVSSSFEECRAECTGCFMSVNADVLKLFGHEGSQASDITYINWLHMARAGLLALEYYSPDTQQWRQAHMQARYAILRTWLAASASDSSAGEPFCQVAPSKDESSDDLQVLINRDKISTVGLPATADLLLKLQVYKATADAAGGTAFYKSLTEVKDQWMAWRDVVMARKQPRPVYVQPHLTLDKSTNKVTVMEFDATHAGIIGSFLARYAHP
eukprot:jgi/Chrzof1/14032/Cz08g21230.t1